MSRQHSAIIKGLAILLMLIYHLPRILGPETMDPAIRGFLASIAHPIQYFVIVSGYGLYYAYSQGRLNWTYLLKRTGRLYIAFWLVIAIFAFGIGSLMYPGKFLKSPYYVITNLIGWRWDFCQFTWFLLTYVLLSFCSKWIFKSIDRLGNIASIILTMFISMGMTWLISRYYLTFLRYNYVVYHPVLVMQMLFSFTIGAAMARIVLSGKEVTWSKLKGKNWLVLLLLLAVFASRGSVYLSSIPFFAAIVVWLILHIEPGVVSKNFFVPLGNMSMMMWFLHGYIGPILFRDYYLMLKWPVLIYVVWVIISFALAWLLMPVSSRISKALKLM